MKRIVKVLLSFVKLAVLDKIAFAKNVVLLLTGNASFPLPTVPLATVTGLIDSLEAKELAARLGGPVETAQMHLAEKLLDDALRKNAQYVEITAANSESVILSSGYLASVSETQPTHEPLQPTNFMAKVLTDAGSIELSCDPLANATSYVYILVKTTGDSALSFDAQSIIVGPSTIPTIIVVDTHRKIVVANLEHATSYNAGMYAVGIKGRGPLSQFVTFTTQ